MSAGIRIHVAGGNATIGNVVQGDGNTVGAHQGTGDGAAARFDAFLAELPALARPYDRPDDEIAQLRREVERLKHEASRERPDVAQGSGVVASIRKNFGWAWPEVKVLLEQAWPVVLKAALG